VGLGGLECCGSESRAPFNNSEMRPFLPSTLKKLDFSSDL